MTREKPRALRIGSDVYRFRVHHRHQKDDQGRPSGCTEIFSVFLEGRHRKVLRILFSENEAHGAEYPRRSGIVVDYREPGWTLNLNRPRVAAVLVELAVSFGWLRDARTEITVEGGYDFVRERRSAFDGV